MTPTNALTSAIFTLQYTALPEDADRVLNVAAARGVDTATCEALRAEWRRMHDASVTVLHADLADCMSRHPSGGAR